MLRNLAGQGIYLGVVSNKTGDFLRREAERLGWTDLFGSMVGAGDAPLDKPACEPVRLALAAAACRPETRCGLSAIPQSIWSAPATAAVSRFSSAI